MYLVFFGALFKVKPTQFLLQNLLPMSTSVTFTAQYAFMLSFPVCCAYSLPYVTRIF